jgi:hypothetical protein
MEPYLTASYHSLERRSDNKNPHSSAFKCGVVQQPG